MDSLRPAADIPIIINSPSSSSERRINPSWTISQFKARLEPITGIPVSAQNLVLAVSASQQQTIESTDEDTVQLSAFTLQPYAELSVNDTRPVGFRSNYTDVTAVEKYEMPPDEYAARSDSVMAFKKKNQLGRFDPEAPIKEEEKLKQMDQDIDHKGIRLSLRCRLLPSTDFRLGTIAFVGLIPEIPGSGPWIGVALDEPTGKNDGSIAGTKYFDAGGSKKGVFVRPERIEVGDFQPVHDELDSDMEEI